MTTSQMIEFAASSARMALDRRDAYEDAIGSFRDNVIDTLNDEGADANTHRRALAKFDAIVARVNV